MGAHSSSRARSCQWVPSNPETYAYKIQEIRRHFAGTAKRGLDREVSQTAGRAEADAPGREPSPSANAVAAELAERLAGARAVLPEDYREVLLLLQDEGLTLAEAGFRMGRSAQAVAKLYGRALCGLTASLREKGERP
jgi:DNA-directed RNA polymerase specialized sigma24 family protein